MLDATTTTTTATATATTTMCQLVCPLPDERFSSARCSIESSHSSHSNNLKVGKIDLHLPRCQPKPQAQPQQQLQSQLAAQITYRHWIWPGTSRVNKGKTRHRQLLAVLAVGRKCCASFGIHCTASTTISVHDPIRSSSWSAVRPINLCPRSFVIRCDWISPPSVRDTSTT